MGGYLDATNFLATYGFVKNCPMCLTVKTVVKKSALKMHEVRVALLLLLLLLAGLKDLFFVPTTYQNGGKYTNLP
jgi:hypothetical protein